MTPMQVWTIIRWPIALLALAAVANYALPRFVETLPTMVEFDAGGIFEGGPTETETEADLALPAPAPTAEPTLAPPTGPVADGEALPIADLYVNGRAANVVDEELLLTDDAEDSITLAFDLPPGDPSCMTSMTLTMTATSVPADGVQASLFASSLTDAVEIGQNFQVDGDLRQSPTAAAMASPLITAAGPVEMDVLNGYQTYFSLGYPPATPFVVTMQTVTQPPVGDPLAFVSSRAENEQVPVLRWTGDPACPAAQ